MLISCLSQSSIFFLHDSHKQFVFQRWRLNPLTKTTTPPLANSRPRLRFTCFSSTGNQDSNPNDSEPKDVVKKSWPVLERWSVPWEWQTASLASLACGLSFVLTGLVESAALPILGINISELSLDQKAELLFVDQSITTAVVLGVLLTIANSFKPLSEDIFRYDLSEPFNLERGWLFWAGIGLGGALAGITLIGAILSLGGETPERSTDALVLLLPLIGSSSISTACLLGITGVLAPILEETVFRGFLMVTLTKWVPTPVSIIVSATAFAGAHLAPGEFPQLFTLGAAMGFSYAQTRNLMTPITIHAFWNSGVILFLTFLQLQGYDLKELIQAS